MLPRKHSGGIRVVFDEHRPVTNAWLILPFTLAHNLYLGELADRHVDLGDAQGQSNTDDKQQDRVSRELLARA
ncbi:MAG: hypothetical protein OXN21_15320 [Chloroflexota bacterium]|nr:hypothetical protein [Chloroflexota bacterium]MDE2844728.1 hypothetical protein [Chloroflexota bacterium]